MLRRNTNTWILIGLVIANGLVWMPRGTGLAAWGGLMLFGLIPGLALMNVVFPRAERPSLLQRLLLGVAGSYVLSNLLVWGLSLLPGEMNLLQLVAALDGLSLVLVAASLVMGQGAFGGGDGESKITWLHVALLLAVLCVFRFTGLGYSQFIVPDEMFLVSLVTKVIAGKESVLLGHIKPPPQITTVLSFVLFDGGYREFTMRLPFAVASVASVLMLYVLGREMFSNRVGFLAASLLALDGIYLAVSRMAQYQGIVLLMALSAIYSFWRAGSVSQSEYRSRWLVLGSVFFAFGCLTHYDGVIELPVLAVVYLTQRRPAWRREAGLLLLCAVLALMIVAPFYLPFFLSERLDSARSYVANVRLGLGSGLYNNVNSFVFSEMLFRNSIYYVGFMLLGLLGGTVVLWWRWVSSKVPLFLAWLCFAVGLTISLVWPSLIQVRHVNLALLFFLPLFAVLFLSKGLLLADRTVWVWLVTGFIVFGFAARVPGTHWYHIMPSWALISGIMSDKVIGLVEKSRRGLVWVPVGILAVLFGGYLYMFFLQQDREYALTFPDHKSLLYWTPQNTLPGGIERPFFGTPVQYGWKVISYLYRTGVLRGHLRVSGGREMLEWYMGHQWDQDEASRYVLYGDSLAPRQVKETGPRADGFYPEAIEQSHTLVGRVLTRGIAKIAIYERKELAQGATVADWSSPMAMTTVEQYGPLYDEMDSLAGRLRYDQVGGDSKTCYQAAGLVEQTSDPDDVVAFTDREQVGPFSYHYAGKLSYHVPASVFSPDDLTKWLGDRPTGQRVYILLWASPKGDERENWDAWAQTYGGAMERAWHGQTGLAVYDPAGESRLHLLQGARLGESIELLGYAVSPVSAECSVSVTLYWAASAQPPQDYTVFTHVVGADGRMRGQKDNEPVGGTRPTSSWRTDQVIRDEYTVTLEDAPAGEYWIDLGMYDRATGQRLPTSGEGAISEGRIRLPRSVKLF